MFTDLLLTSLLSGTDGPTDFSAGGLWARGDEDLSSSVTSVVTTSTASTCWIGVSASRKALFRSVSWPVLQVVWIQCGFLIHFMILGQRWQQPPANFTQHRTATAGGRYKDTRMCMQRITKRLKLFGGDNLQGIPALLALGLDD